MGFVKLTMGSYTGFVKLTMGTYVGFVKLTMGRYMGFEKTNFHILCRVFYEGFEWSKPPTNFRLLTKVVQTSVVG